MGSYPFLKSIDWNSDLYIKPLPGVTPKNALLAVDKTIGAEQAVLWSKPTRGQRGRQGLLRVQGRCEGRALSEDGGQRARLYLCFLKPVGSYVLVTSESFLPVWRPRALARCAPVKYFRVVRQRYTIQNLAAALR